VQCAVAQGPELPVRARGRRPLSVEESCSDMPPVDSSLFLGGVDSEFVLDKIESRLKALENMPQQLVQVLTTMSNIQLKISEHVPLRCNCHQPARDGSGHDEVLDAKVRQGPVLKRAQTWRRPSVTFQHPLIGEKVRRDPHSDSPETARLSTRTLEDVDTPKTPESHRNNSFPGTPMGNNNLLEGGCPAPSGWECASGMSDESEEAITASANARQCWIMSPSLSTVRRITRTPTSNSISDSRRLNFAIGEDGHQEDSSHASSLTSEGIANRLSLQPDGIVHDPLPTTAMASGPTAFILHPHAFCRLVWDFIIATVTLLVGVTVPVFLAYLNPRDLEKGAFDSFSTLVMVLWVADIFLTFRTGYDEEGAVVMSPRKIARRYVRGWLVLDIIVVLPVSPISSLMPSEEGTVVLVLSALKLLRTYRLGPLIDTLPKGYRMPVKLLIVVLLLSHVMSCGWRIVRQSGLTDKAEHSSDWLPLYITDLYWVMMTMTTVGYGDIPPETTGDRVYAILAMLISPLFFGTIVSLLTHVTQGLFHDETDVRLKESLQFLRNRQISQELQRRVMQNLQRRIREEHHVSLPPDLYAKLSPWLQRELCLELISSTVLCFPLFKGAQHSFVADLAVRHTLVFCLPGDLVVEEGQLAQELIFVIHGRLLITKHQDSPYGPARNIRLLRSETQLLPVDPSFEVEIEAGGWIGEACLFNEASVRQSTALAAIDSELAVLRREDYHDLIARYPHIKEKHQVLEDAFRTGALPLSRLACKRAPSLDVSKKKAPFARVGERLNKSLRLVSERSSWHARVSRRHLTGWLRHITGRQHSPS